MRRQGKHSAQDLLPASSLQGNAQPPDRHLQGTGTNGTKVDVRSRNRGHQRGL
jgi:hypothetical protein